MATLEERADLIIRARKAPEIIPAALALCKDDPVFWFNNFCYTFDPRLEESTIPFNLYPVQEWFIRVLRRCIDTQRDFGIEKSRDMGVSWMVILLFQWYWLFQPGCTFHVGSITMPDVDNGLVDPDNTLFGKFRFNYELLPTWMKPKMSYKFLTLQNMENGSNLTGQAPTMTFSRGKRKKAIFFDELPHWQNADAAYQSASQTTNCRIINGTPNGKFNKYGRLMTAEGNRRIIWPGRAALKEAKNIA